MVEQKYEINVVKGAWLGPFCLENPKHMRYIYLSNYCLDYNYCARL